MRSLASSLIVLCLLSAGLPSLLARENDRLELFAKAHALYTAGSLASAKQLFQETLSQRFTLGDYSLYYLSTIVFEEKAWEESRHLTARLAREYPESLWIDAAQLQQAKIDLAEKKLSQARKTLQTLRRKKTVRSEILEEALFLQAQATENAKDAHDLYQQLREEHPNSRWTAPARREQASLRAKEPESFPSPTVPSLIAEADQLVRERAYSEAERVLKKLLNNSDDPSVRLRLLTKLAGVYLTLRRRNDAVPLLERIARDFPDSPEAPNALYQIGNILWNRHENARALVVFEELTARYPASSVVARAAYAAGDIHDWLSNKEAAIASYNKVRFEFPGNQVRDDATWRLAWLHYRSNELPDAYRMFSLLASEARENTVKTAAHYWQGRSAEKAGDRELAKQIYQDVYDTSPESYYQALAGNALSRLGAPAEEQISEAPARGRNLEPAATTPRMAFHLARARALSSVGLYALAVGEISAVEDLAGNDNGYRLYLAREYFNNRAYRRSLSLAAHLPASDSERDLYRFPLAHWQLIQQIARERELDPYLIVALIRQESLFDARARSPAFALGLMQLLPSTAARVAGRAGMAPPSEEKLFDPELNLTLGSLYLKELLQRYSNNWFKAIAAYNAGEAAVDRWEKEITTNDIEEFVERIPYMETRLYVKLVMRNHRLYKKLYESGK